MSWAKVCDRLHAHPKARTAGLEAIGFWTLCLSHCAAYATKGYVTRDVTLGVTLGDAETADRCIAKLVEAGLWEPVESGWFFHDYDDYQENAESIIRKRKLDAKRQAKRREKLLLALESDEKKNKVTRCVTRDTTRDSRCPVPSRPVLSLSSKKESRKKAKQTDLEEYLETKVTPVAAMAALESKSNGRVVAGDAKIWPQTAFIRLASHLKKVPGLQDWVLVGEYLGAGYEAWRKDTLSVSWACSNDFLDMLGKAKAWASKGRPKPTVHGKTYAGQASVSSNFDDDVDDVDMVDDCQPAKSHRGAA